MKRSIVVIAFVLICCVTVVVSSNAAVYNGHEYQLTVTAMQWAAAEAAAVTAGGHLVTINDAAEQAWLQNTFLGSGTYWIGLTFKLQGWTWVWSSGEPVTSYTNWASGEPNNSGGSEFSGTLRNFSPYNGAWNDESGGYSYFGIVETIAPVPIPPAVWLLGSGLIGLIGIRRFRR